jgi:hypothetical protein
MGLVAMSSLKAGFHIATFDVFFWDSRKGWRYTKAAFIALLLLFYIGLW